MLTHLFQCIMNDGTVIQQTQDDISTTDPTRSAFYDVKQRLSDVVCFTLTGHDHVYSVSLRNGHFLFDNVEFDARPDGVPEDHSDYRLIYFRRHYHTVVQGQETNHRITYYIGWQTTINGKNFQQIIGIEQ